MEFPKLTERQEDILEAIIRVYIETALPVGSAAALVYSGLTLSPATIRNEMTSLEVAGLIVSPHTSAGRIPTDVAYEYYVAHLLNEVSLPLPEERQFKQISSLYGEFDERVRQLAKAVAAFSSEGVFVVFAERDIYYTGLTNLFAQPEFREQQQLYAMSQVIDRLDEAAADVFGDVRVGEACVLVGSKNPFGSGCSAILTRCPAGGSDIVFGILGPTRMNYDLNVVRAQSMQAYITI